MFSWFIGIRFELTVRTLTVVYHSRLHQADDRAQYTV
jgi:hypothetical protein